MINDKIKNMETLLVGIIKYINQRWRENDKRIYKSYRKVHIRDFFFSTWNAWNEIWKYLVVDICVFNSMAYDNSMARHILSQD